jgi:hypothetical protein
MWVIVIDANPRQGIKDSLRPLRLVARLVGVFDAQNKYAVVGQRQNPVVQSSTGATHMKKAGW